MSEGFAPYRRWLERALVLWVAVDLVLAPATAAAAGVLTGRTIVVDPGHGGVDSGAVANRLEEKLLTLPIGLDLGSYLRGYGARVVFTRTADVTIGPVGNVAAGLAARVALANAVGADSYISIHANSLDDPNYSGLMTFYGQSTGYVSNVTRSDLLVNRGQLLAEAVQQSVLQRTGALDQGVHAANYYVLGYTAMPSILVETGFITNAAEAGRLATPSYQQAIAAGIANGVVDYVQGRPLTPTAPDTTPSGVPTPTVNAYTVQSGDTLSGIAMRLNVSAVALARDNRIVDPNSIRAGRRLELPPTRQAPAVGTPASSTASAGFGSGAQEYTVRAGDTLSQIAMRYGIPLADLIQANGIGNANAVTAGRRLQLPDRGPTTSASPSPDATTSTSTSTYAIQPGDTLSGIASRFHIAESALVQLNGLRDPDHVVAGRTLVLPVH